MHIENARQGLIGTRPWSDELLAAIVRAFDDLTPIRIVITELRDAKFHACVEFEHHGEPITIDSRPSDAIALALRLGMPIYADEQGVSDALLERRDDPTNSGTA